MNLKKDGSRPDNYQHYSPSNTTRSNPAKFLTDEDLIILRDIAHNIYHFSSGDYSDLENKRGRQILERILEGKKCYWQKPIGEPIKLA